MLYHFVTYSGIVESKQEILEQPNLCGKMHLQNYTHVLPSFFSDSIEYGNKHFIQSIDDDDS